MSTLDDLLGAALGGIPRLLATVKYWLRLP